MASTTEKIGTEATVQQHGDVPPLPNWRPPRRASTLQYDPPSASSSDSDSNTSSVRVVDVTRSRARGKKDPWYKKMRIARNKVTKKKNQTLTPPPPPPNPAQTNDDDIVVIEEEDKRVPRRRSGGAFWRPNRGRRAETVIIEEQHYSDPERGLRWYGAPTARSRFGTLGALLGRRPRRNARTPTMSMSSGYSSYSYSDYYTDSSDEEVMDKMRVFHYDIEESGVRSDPGEAYFDSSRFKLEKTGRERGSLVFREKLTKAFNDAYTQEAPNKVKLILIQNNQDAMVNFIRNAFSDSHWFRRYGEELINRVDKFGPPTKKAQFFRILHDEKRNIVQSAFCINHWVIPLDSSSHDRLQQLVVYWQYQWSDGKEKQETEGSSTIGAAVKDGDQAGPPTGAAATPAAAPTSSTNKKTNRGTAATKNVDETKEPLFNSNVIVIFERSRIRNRYRRSRKSIVLDSLSDFVPSSNFAVKANEGANVRHSKERLVGLHITQMLKYVIETVCDSLTDNLDETIDSYSTQRARLAEKVYQKPDDDTLASKLWAYSRAFQNAGKIINLLALLVDDIRSAFGHHLDDKRLSESFLTNLPNKFKTLAIDVEEELQKPTAEMIDLVYKSVSIKDARLSLELNSSLWRLSWVTFIFLPLTFLVGFFGMNVDTFANDPSIKWYFIAAVPFLICVMISWLFFKYCMKRRSSRDAKLSFVLIRAVIGLLALFLGMKRRSRTRSRSRRTYV